MYITKNEYVEKTRLRDESIFTCASGKLGVRGNFEEGVPSDLVSIRGTYINGFSETEEITYNEKLCGFPEEKQTIVNLPDAQTIEIFADGELINCLNKDIKDYNYTLDMEKGEVIRNFIYPTKNGDLKLSFERFASFKRQGLFVIRCKVKSLNYKGNLKINSTLNGNVVNFTNASDPRVASGSGKMLVINSCENIVFNDENESKVIQKIEAETINSHRSVSCNVINSFNLNNSSNNLTLDVESKDNVLTAYKELVINENDELVITKFCFYHEIPDEVDGIKELLNAYNAGFDCLKDEQVSFMNRFWKTSRVLIDSNEIKQEHIDLCLYVMLASAGRDNKTSIAAKGLSGEGYEGHYFWDCETYIFPFFLLTNPDIAKALLMYRYSKLDEAKKHARTMGHKMGTLYPWRTITGSECSSYFPSGSAQYHINGDIARAFIQYYNVTNDKEFLPVICEVLLETSRLWIDTGHYDNGLFKIDCVTGPDEYTCLVNNNYYTNSGAANNLKYAVKLIRELMNIDKYSTFKKKTGFNEDELLAFEKAADNMYYPYDKQLGIIKQDDSFLNKKKIDLKSIPKNEFPLLLNYHPLHLYRLQICKQADAVLADHLYCDLDALTSKRTFDYYEEVTTHDSSLSKCIFGIVAAKLGDLNKAKDYFIETLATDINDCKGNTRDGLHMANMGGCYRMVTSGFGGLKINDRCLSLFPQLPKGINSYSFPLFYRNTILHVYVDSNGCELYVDGNNSIEIEVYGKHVNVTSKAIRCKREIKGVIFDLDGVITDTAIYHYQAWKKIADELNVDFDEKRNENFKGVSRRKCLELLLEWGKINLDNEQFDKVLEKKNNYYRTLLTNLTPKDILPGIKEAIEKLHKAGIKVALFSVSKNTDDILNRLDIRDYFDVIVSGKDITNSKPHYEGYLLAADRMHIDSKLCMMIEDSVSGINGAKALSMKTVAIMSENSAHADYCLNSTEELTNILELL